MFITWYCLNSGPGGIFRRLSKVRRFRTNQVEITPCSRGAGTSIFKNLGIYGFVTNSMSLYPLALNWCFVDCLSRNFPAFADTVSHVPQRSSYKGNCSCEQKGISIYSPLFTFLRREQGCSLSILEVAFSRFGRDSMSLGLSLRLSWLEVILPVLPTC